MGCCEKEDDTRPEKYEEDRNCTDVLFLLIFILFWIGFIVIASIGFANGDPDRLLYGTDYLGFVCGKGDGPEDFASYETNTRWQNTAWGDNIRLWYPISNESNSLGEIMDRGICVTQCPYMTNETLIAVEEANYNYFALPEEILTELRVKTYGTVSRLNGTVNAPPVYYNTYSSKTFYRRCLPSGLQPSSLNETLAGIPGASSTSSFFFRGIIEVAASWRIFLITIFIALIFCYIYVFLMRIFISVLIWTCIVAVFVLIMFAGWMMLDRANELEDQNTENDTDAERYVKAWRYTGYIVFCLGALYLILVIWSKERIKLACAMIKVAGRVIAAAPSMLLIPPLVTIAVAILLLWCLYVAVYLYTADDYTQGRPTLGKVFNNDSSLISIETQQIGNETFANFTNGFLDSDNAKRNLLFYDLFGFLWTMGFINAIGFTIIAFMTVFWYFSSLHDDEKEIPNGSIFRATGWTLFYHTGTLALGSFLVAVVQFIRFLLKYVATQCEWIKNSDTIKCIICIAECCLACFERIIKIISKNAYIMMCITSDCFFFAARDAFNIIIDNAMTMAILTFVVELVMFIGKLLIVCGCVLLAYLMMNEPTLAPGVETRILPLILIAFMVYIICCIFFNVYNTTVDASFICYSHDRIVNAGKKLYYVPEELEHQIKNYNQKQRATEFTKEQESAASEPIKGGK